MDLQALRDKDRETPEETGPQTPAQVLEQAGQEYEQTQKELKEIHERQTWNCWEGDSSS